MTILTSFESANLAKVDYARGLQISIVWRSLPQTMLSPVVFVKVTSIVTNFVTLTEHKKPRTSSKTFCFVWKECFCRL